MDYFLIKSKWKFIVTGFLCFLAGIVAVYLFLGGGTDEGNDTFVLPWEEEVTVGLDVERTMDNQNAFYIDIKGEVVYPGLYEMEEGERVFHAIERAGGFTVDAEQKAVNLAEKCYDEMVLYVPSKEEVETGGALGMQSSSSSGKEELIQVNRATADELTKLPGIGPAKADAIIRHREEYGPFQRVEELVNVPGIGEKTLENIRDMIKVP